MKEVKRKLSLHRPVAYEIKAPGHLDESWLASNAGVTVRVESDEDRVVTTLKGTVDQAASHGLLGWLISTSLPLLSVSVCRTA